MGVGGISRNDLRNGGDDGTTENADGEVWRYVFPYQSGIVSRKREILREVKSRLAIGLVHRVPPENMRPGDTHSEECKWCSLGSPSALLAGIDDLGDKEPSPLL